MALVLFGAIYLLAAVVCALVGMLPRLGIIFIVRGVYRCPDIAR
jgi:hypothetical protein